MFNSTCFHLLRISTQDKTVTSRCLDSVEVSLGPKSKRGNSFVRIITHKNLSYCVNGKLILVRSSWIHIVQRSWVLRGPIRPCEINSHDHIEFETSSQVVNKRWFLIDLIFFKDQPSRFFNFRIVENKSGSLPQLRCLNNTLTNKLVLSILLPVPNFQPKYH